MTTSVPTPVQQNPATAPIYTPWDVARYFHIPVWSVFLMTGRFRPWFHPEWLFRHLRRTNSRLADDDLPYPDGPDTPARLSFAQSADLFVLGAVFQLIEAVPSDRGSDERLWHSILDGLDGIARRPLLQSDDPTEVERLVSRFRLADEESALLRKWLYLHLARVEFAGQTASRIFPFSRDPAEDSPRQVVLDPRIRFGRPTLVGRGLPTDSVIDRYRAGDSVADLASDYDVTTGEIEEAIRYECLPTFPLIPMFPW